MVHEKNGYAETTIRATGKRLRHLERNCNLEEPEDVKGYIANKKCSNAYKETLIEIYDLLMKSINQKWQKPFYARYDKLPKIPTEEQINMLISKASPRMALFLSMSKDLGTRPIELTWLQIKDINLQNGVINITSSKHFDREKRWVAKRRTHEIFYTDFKDLACIITANSKEFKKIFARAKKY